MGHVSDVSWTCHGVPLLARVHLVHVLFALVKHLLLPEGGVVVEANLRVGGEEQSARVLGDRVHLDHRAVVLDKHVV